MTLKDKPDINKYKKRSESLNFIFSPERITNEITKQKENINTISARVLSEREQRELSET